MLQEVPGVSRKLREGSRKFREGSRKFRESSRTFRECSRKLWECSRKFREGFRTSKMVFWKFSEGSGREIFGSDLVKMGQ